MISEFKLSQEIIKNKQSKGPAICHNEQVKSVQATFAKQVKSICNVIEEMGNPFVEESEDLLILDTRDIADARISETIRHVERLGKEQFESFVSERLEKRSKSLNVPIKQNKLLLFSCQEPKKTSPKLNNK